MWVGSVSGWTRSRVWIRAFGSHIVSDVNCELDESLCLSCAFLRFYRHLFAIIMGRLTNIVLSIPGKITTPMAF